MRHSRKKSIAMVLAVVSLLQVIGNFPMLAVTASTEGGSGVVKDILNDEGVWLTEIYVDDESRKSARSTGIYDPITTFTTSDGSGADLMEFIEITSTHDDSISLNDSYDFYYNGTPLTVTDMEGSGSIKIEKGQCAVIWNYRSDLNVKDAAGNPLSEAHFRSAMKVPEDAIVLKTEYKANWNDTSSSFSVKRKADGKTICGYTVSTGVVSNGTSVELQVPDKGSAMTVYRKYSIPSAGSYDTSCGVNTKNQLNGLISGKDATGTPEGVFVTEIKAEDIDRSATYGTTQDLMEYVEVYNTTDRRVDLNADYIVKYWVRETYRERLTLYSDEGLLSTQGCTVGPGKTAILWCYRKNSVTDATAFPTEQDFRDAYGVADDVPVYFFQIQSYGNELIDNKRGIEIYQVNGDDTQTLVSSFGYIDTDAYGDGINALQLKPNHDRPQMLFFSAYGVTPGEFKTNQMTFDDDGTKLIITPDDNDTDYTDPVTVPGSIMQGEELRVLFRCDAGIDSNGNKSPLVRTKTTMYYRFKTNGEWAESWTEKAELTNTGQEYLRVPEYYEAIVSAYDLYTVEAVQFYLKAYNKYRCTFSDVYQVEVTKLSQVDGIRTNISEGEYVKGTVAITANDGRGNSGLTLCLDGTTTYTADQLSPMLEDGAYLTFTMSGRGKAGRHALTTATEDNTLIKPLSYWYDMVQDGQAVKIDSSLFTRSVDAQGNATYDVTVRFWAGTPSTYLFQSSYINSTDIKYYNNIDPYTLHGLSLRVNDNVYSATSLINRKNAVVEPNADGDYNIGADSSGTRHSYFSRVDVSFSVPETDVPALGIRLDTESLSDGMHTLELTSGTDTKTVHFMVDNTPPGIRTNLNTDDTLTGSVTMDPTVTDAGPVTTVVVLDGEEIPVPYTTAASELGKGEHTLEVYATDAAGNTAEEKTTFTVDYADISAAGGTATDIRHDGATLNLTVESGFADAEATFFKAEKIESVEFESVTDSDVPYLKYTVDVGEAADTDEIVVNWAGTFEARDGYSVKMYVRNTAAQVEASRWDLIATADAAGKIDKASFPAENHVDADGKATIILQYLTDSATPDLDPQTASIDPGDWDGNSLPGSYDFCFAWQADPQYYTEKYKGTGIYSAMNQWIVDNADDLKIKYVINVGDLIDDLDMTYQWEIADGAMKIFDDAGMPYGVLAGNHDVGESLADTESYREYFGEERFASQPTYGGSYQNNLGHYDLVSQNGEDFIIVYMSWNFYQEEIEWINKVLKEHEDRKAILCFHAFVVPRIKTTASRIDYFGELLERTVVQTNPNVIAVLNGHYYGSAYYVRQYDDTGDGVNDRTVYHICKDYQAGANGGNGYMDLLCFDMDAGKIYLNSYSPVTDDFNYFDEDIAYEAIKNTTGYYEQTANCNVVKELSIDTPDGESGDYYNAFILDMEFDTVTQTITGNRFSAYLCKQEQFGTVGVDPLSGTAAVRAENLAAETDYVWYAAVSNRETGYLRTDFYEFTTTVAPDPVVIPTVTLKYPTLQFEDEILMTVYYTLDVGDIPLEDMGMLTWSSKPDSVTIDTAEAVIPGAAINDAGGDYSVNSRAIPAKQLGDPIFFCVYVKLTDGTYVYSRQVSYSPRTYAYNQVNDTTLDQDVRALVAAMLNYGAAAQTLFAYNTDDLVNANLTDEQKNLVREYDPSMVQPISPADSSRVGIFASSGGFSGKRPSIAFEGAFCINYYFTVNAQVAGDVTFYYWTREAYESAEILTAANASGIMTMTADATTYNATVSGIAAKELDRTIYAAGVYQGTDGTTYSTGVLAYSVGAYCVSQASSDSENMKRMAAATAVYGYCAKNYFTI